MEQILSLKVQKGSTLKKKFAPGSKFFPLRVHPFLKEGKNENGRVIFLEAVPIVPSVFDLHQ